MRDEGGHGGGAGARTVRELMQHSGVAFGTSGARGLVSAMTDEVCAAYVRAFLEVVAREFRFTRVALGMDLRPSSPRIAAACVQAVRDAGFEADFCGVLPTPALALHAMAAGIPAIMVTGSHIPFDRNGLKFYRPDGEISKADETAIAAVVLPESPRHAPAPLPAANSAALAAYVRRYLDYFPQGMLAGLRIGLYEHSSAAREVMREILEGLGAEVLSLGRTDEFVPIDTEAVSAEDAARGREWAQAHGLDALVSTDGDGDRPLVGDEHGRWLRGDLLGLLCARELRLDTIAVPVSCNTAIEASQAFAIVDRTRIGSPYVIEAMQARHDGARAIGGFEANGGFLLGSRVEREGRRLEALPTRDAVLPVLAVLSAAKASSVQLSGLLEGLPARHTASDRVQSFPTARSSALVSAWAETPAELLSRLGLGSAGIAHADRTDGLRLTTGAGEIVHLRPSGNAPELRCYCEAATPGRAAELVDTTIQYLSSVKES